MLTRIVPFIAMALAAVAPRLAFLIVGLLSLAVTQPLRAGFVFSSLDLRNSVTDGSGGPLLVDDDRITTATNPLNQTSVAQVGMNIVESTYAYQWNEGLGTADFNTDISHAMRSQDITTITRIVIFIEPTEALRVTVEGAINYAHTPGDDTSLLFGMSVRDLTTFDDVFVETLQGGNALLLPAAGTLAVSGEATLNAGTLYRLQAVLDNDNISESDPGVLDASGFANFTIRPLVPEPHTGVLLLLTGAIAVRRRSR